ncbi:hypothetical protein B0H14DRAFT_2595076 [Mycena olivaceomarginata]|nr:hypothetical protein B0H14DRAFT_2595076 [Mycena olivaceomarginata]
MSTSLLECGRSRRAQQQAAAALETPRLGERALKKVKLDSETEAEFRTYIETTSQDERHMMQFLHTLQVESMLIQSLQVPVSAWKSSPALLESMRKSDVPNLPPVDSAGCDGLVKDVAREYSVQRSTFKKKVNDTLPNKKIDVATLTASLVAHSEHVNATLGLYHRVAFVRLLSTRGYSNAEFWTKVDDELAALHAGAPEDRVLALQIAYEDDIQAHGDPANSKHKTGTGVESNSPRWLRNLNTLVPQIQRFSRRQGTKRKRPSTFDNDNTDNNEDEQEEPEVRGNNDGEMDPDEQGGEEATT